MGKKPGPGIPLLFVWWGGKESGVSRKKEGTPWPAES